MACSVSTAVPSAPHPQSRGCHLPICIARIRVSSDLIWGEDRSSSVWYRMHWHGRIFINKGRFFQLISECCSWPEFRQLGFSSLLITISFSHPCHRMNFSTLTNSEECKLAAEKHHRKCMVIQGNGCQQHKSYSCVRGKMTVIWMQNGVRPFVTWELLQKKSNSFKVSEEYQHKADTCKSLLRFLCGACSNPSEGFAPRIS